MANDYQQLHDFADEIDGKSPGTSSYDELHDLARNIDEQTLESMKGYAAPKEITKFSSTLDPKPQDTWSRLKDMMASAGLGYTEGITADKTAELLSSVSPIKTNTQQVQSIINRQHEDNPISYTVGNAFGVAMSPLAKLGLPAYSAISGAEGDTWGDKGIGAGVGGVLGAATGAIADKALPYIGSKFPELTQYIGKAMQIPQQLSEGAMETAGSIGRKIPFIEKHIKPNPKTLENPSLFSESKKMSDLKSIIDASRMSSFNPQVAEIVKTAENDAVRGLTADKSIHGSMGDKFSNIMGVDPLNRMFDDLKPEEQSIVRDAIAEGLKKRGVPVPDDPILRENAINRFYTPKPGDSVRDAIRITNKRDLAYYVNGLKNASDAYTPLLENTMNTDPHYYDLVNTNDILHKKIQQGAINRMMQQNGPPVRGWSPVSQIDNDARNFYQMNANSSLTSPNEGTKIINSGTQQSQVQAKKQAQQKVQMTKPWLGDATEEMIKNRTGVDIANNGTLKQAAAVAANRVGNVQAGQSMMNMVAGAGSVFGGGYAAASHAYPSVSTFLGMAPQAMSWAGKAGQAVEKKGAAMTPDNFASQFLTNPSIIQQMAQAPGITGQIGQYLGKGLESMGIDGVKSRLFTSMTNPTFREEILKMMGNRGNPDDRPGSTVNINQ